MTHDLYQGQSLHQIFGPYSMVNGSAVRALTNRQTHAHIHKERWRRRENSAKMLAQIQQSSTSAHVQRNSLASNHPRLAENITPDGGPGTKNVSNTILEYSYFTVMLSRCSKRSKLRTYLGPSRREAFLNLNIQVLGFLRFLGFQQFWLCGNSFCW